MGGPAARVAGVVSPEFRHRAQLSLGPACRRNRCSEWTGTRADPDLLEVAAAAESAISGSALIIQTHATYCGYDPEPRVRQSRQRRDMLDVLMREQVAGQMTNPAPLIPAGP